MFTSKEIEYYQHPWQDKINNMSLLVRWCPACGAITIVDPRFGDFGDVELPEIAKEPKYLGEAG